MRTRTTSQPSGMEIRPHSRPESTGPYMTGTVNDSSIGHTQRSRDIGPDTDEESNLRRLINKRAQQLKDDRQSLKDRLERYVQLRATQQWTPPTHPSYNLFDARLKSFETWTHKEGVPLPESLAEERVASSFEVYIQHCTKQIFFPRLTLLSKTFSLASNTLSLQAIWTTQRAFIVTLAFVTGFQVTLLLPNTQDGHPSACTSRS